jgi:hypothetical protein
VYTMSVSSRRSKETKTPARPQAIQRVANDIPASTTMTTPATNVTPAADPITACPKNRAPCRTNVAIAAWSSPGPRGAFSAPNVITSPTQTIAGNTCMNLDTL